jgi:ATP-binding cassette subfamily B protein/subfamily B ATP-binding cassette protein MsbA
MNAASPDTATPRTAATAATAASAAGASRPADPVDEGLLLWTLSFLRPYRRRVALLAVLLLAEIGLGALQPWPLEVVIDYVLGGLSFPSRIAPLVSALTHDRRGVLLVAVVIGGVVLQVVNQFVSAYGTQVQVDTGQRMVYDLRRRLFQHLTALGLHHHITTSTADAVYRVDVDAYAIENLVMSGIFPLATSITSLTVMFAILLWLNVTIALLSLAVVPFMYLCLRYYTSTLVNREERVKELESKLLERLYETFGAMRLVKSFAREPHELQRYARAGDTTMNARIAITWQQSLFSVVVSTITILGTALVVIVGGTFVMRGRLTIGELTVVISYLGAVYGPLSAIAHTTGQLQGALAGARRVRSMFALLPETAGEDDAPDAVDAAGIKGDISFEGVGFTYPSGANVLHDISFTAKPGEMVALVGLTGAGKTTLVSLIPRFYDPSTGRVLIDGVDARRYRVRSLRERIGIVLQDPVLFAGSLADNLRYGRLDATPHEIEEAARAAHAHEFISRLPKGYDTEIAEAGGGLSGGERQRLSLARAILKNAPILILDEPTSSLDAISEEIVFAAVRRLRAGRTTIVIAHRLSTVRDADRILVLDGGKIAAQGKHDELLRTSQLYRRMCARLSVGKSLDEPESVDELIQAARR